MTPSLTITRQFHSTRRRDRQQQLRPGPAPNTSKGKIPRISRLMALAIHCDELVKSPSNPPSPSTPKSPPPA